MVARTAVVEGMKDGVIVLNSQNRVLNMNPASRWLSKLPASKAVGLPVEQVISNEDVLRMIHDSVDEAAGQIKVGDGPAWRNYDVTVSALRDHGRREANRFVMVREVTERVSRDLLFRLLVESASDMIAIYDTSGTPRYVSPSIERVLGYEPGEALTAMAAPEIIHPEDRAWVRERREKVRSCPGEHPSIVFRVRHKDGSWRYVEGVTNNLRADPEVRGVVASWRDVTERVEAEREIRRLNETLEKRVAERTERLAESKSRLKELVGKLVAAQEEERRRVAYEIHDGLTQVAIAAHQKLQVFARAHPPGSSVEEGELDRTLALAQRTVREARHVIEGLRPTSLDDFGLAAALRLEVDELQEEGWEVACEENLGEERLDPEIETALFRVAREALTNARKHAHTTRAAVKLSCESEEVRLEITDWGRGFDASAPSRRGPGEKVGLAGMRERVALLGGVLTIISRPGSGTTVTAAIPLGVPLGYPTQHNSLDARDANTKAQRRPYREG